MKSDLEAWTQSYLDGTISRPDLALLNQRLAADAEARRVFSEWLNLDSAIGASAAGWLPADGSASAPQANWRPARSTVTIRRAVVVAACVLLLLGGGWWYSTQRVMATVVREVGVQELRKGDVLRRQNHVLRAGTIELLTPRGTRIVIEAPAEMQFESAQRLQLRRGRLSADVSPAMKGFTVITPSGEAVDLGTRFGVDVPADGPVEVHVFQGEVIARPNGDTAQSNLHGGDALAMDGRASVARELRTSAFIQHPEMAGLSAGLAAGQQALSNDALAKVKQDPALIALLDFESDKPQPGVFRVVQGRWPGSQAPEFVNGGDHLQLDVGGEQQWPQLTLAAWVRLDQLGSPYQSLLHTDGWNEEAPGQVHWMVTRHMTMRLALFGNTLAPGSEEQESFPDSRTSVLPEEGRWIHLATVYDSQARTVRFYLNGRFDKETRQAIAHPARLGSAQIGNWDRQDRKLSGRIDEIVLLGRALSDDEVRQLFEAGNPYR